MVRGVRAAQGRAGATLAGSGFQRWMDAFLGGRRFTWNRLLVGGRGAETAKGTQWSEWRFT